MLLMRVFARNIHPPLGPGRAALHVFPPKGAKAWSLLHPSTPPHQEFFHKSPERSCIKVRSSCKRRIATADQNATSLV